ncbi:hypothetical protein [Streptomyces melanogenes]|uniref:hypothetical protein n=1 Tax=Streptomyces melanogenes TaxID=67326 RepID=UPI0037A76C52
MAIFSEIKKVDESEQEVRYSFSNGIDVERLVIFDKVNEISARRTVSKTSSIGLWRGRSP